MAPHRRRTSGLHRTPGSLNKDTDRAPAYGSQSFRFGGSVVGHAAAESWGRTITKLFSRLAGPVVAACLTAYGPASAGAESADYVYDEIAADDAAAADADLTNDPIEPVNRVIFEFNEVFLNVVLQPIAKAYRFVPGDFRLAIANFLRNLNAPLVLANDILQGEVERAMRTTGRFVANSTIGLGGLVDVAEFSGIPGHTEDLGQTFAVWGVGEGFYLVIPVLGPSNPRDAIGRFVEGYFDPVDNWISNTNRDYLGYTRQGVTAVSKYEGVMDDLDEIRRTSIDYYAAIRSMFRQRRAAEIRNGKDVDLPPIPDINLSLDLEDGDGEPPNMAGQGGAGPNSAE